MQRFSLPNLSFGKNLIIGEISFVHQISRVLRSSIGESIILFNGDGWEYLYTISSIDKKEIGLSFEKKYANISDSKILIRLYQAIPNKYEKIEYILQKGVEVGVGEFIFFRSERSQRLAINEHKLERFHEIVREATEQCQGNQIPTITFLENGLSTMSPGQSYVLHTEGEDSIHLRDINISLLPINIFVGPEGGWSPSEILFFEENNIKKIHLGERILRTETAGPVVTFFLLEK